MIVEPYYKTAVALGKPVFLQVEVSAGDREAFYRQTIETCRKLNAPLYRLDRLGVERFSFASERWLREEADGLSFSLAEILPQIETLQGIFIVEFAEHEDPSNALLALRLRRLNGHKLLVFLTEPGEILNIPYLREKLFREDFPGPDLFEIADIGRRCGLKKFPFRFKNIVKAARGLDRETTEQLFTHLSTLPIEDEEALARVHAFKAKYILKNADILEYQVVSQNPLVFGFSALQKWAELRMEEILQGRCQKGVLLCGIPGTGKTSAATLLAYRHRLPLVKLHLGLLKSPYQGEAESRFRKALKMIDRLGPCIVLADEYDKTLAAMGQNPGVDGGVGSSLLSLWLEWLEKPKDTLVVATSNSLDLSGPEQRRLQPFFVDYPDLETTKAILWTRVVKEEIEVDIEDVFALANKMAHLFTGDHIKRTVKRAALRAKTKGLKPCLKDLLWAYEKELDQAISFHIQHLHLQEEALRLGLPKA